MWRKHAHGLAATLAAAALAAGCGEVPRPRPCGSGGDCAADSRCVRGSCVADTPPVAVITAPTTLLSNRALTFDGMKSYDPDADDRVVSHAWKVTPLGAMGAGCDPLPTSGADPVLPVVFPCAGEFDVQLVVADALGIRSPPQILRAAVALSPDPPTVTTGPPLALDHRCRGTPLRCTPTDGTLEETFQLGAAATSPAPGALAYRWTYLLPSALDGKPPPRVTFTPGPADPNPTVLIETDGSAISGDWKFTVAATDSRGAVGVGAQAVAIGNRAPVVGNAGPAALSVPHAFTPTSAGASAGSFTAQGMTPSLTFSDPDGDLLQTAFAASHAGDGGNAFVAQDLGDHASFSAVVLYSGPADGAYLIGPGVSRSIQFTAADPNGGVASASWRVEVQNRAPRVASSFPSLTVPHFFDAPNSRYMTVNTLAFFVDDDGDPLFVEAASPNLTCSASLAGQAAEVLCTAPYSGTPAANAISGLRAVATTARDPWASASASTTLNVTNRSPRLTAGAVGIPPTCTQGSCCLIDPETKRCVEYRFSQGVSSTTIPPPVIDDDGDPLLIDYAAGGGCLGISHGSDICAPGSCRDLGLSLCGAPSTCGGTSTSGTVSVYATDGDSPFSGSFAVGTGCP